MAFYCSQITFDCSKSSAATVLYHSSYRITVPILQFLSYITPYCITVLKSHHFTSFAQKFQMKIKGIRLVTKLPMTVQRFPKTYDRSAGYKYHVALLYLLPGCRLSLAIKSYNCKVPVIVL